MTEWDKIIRARGRCCACGGSLKSSRLINLIMLNRYATWRYPAWGNILAKDQDKRAAKRAGAILCDRCLEEKRDPRQAVEFKGQGEDLEIIYHDIKNLEDAEPITEEDIEEPPMNFGLEERIRQFDELVEKAAEIHTYTWCVREQTSVITMILDGRVCCKCPEFVMNGGVCDPL